MEDEAAEQRDTARRKDQAVPRSTLQEQPRDRANVSTLPVAGNAQYGASLAWQQKVQDVEAKLQGDLQQDLARLVLRRASQGPSH